MYVLTNLLDLDVDAFVGRSSFRLLKKNLIFISFYKDYFTPRVIIKSDMSTICNKVLINNNAKNQAAMEYVRVTVIALWLRVVSNNKNI